MLTFIVPSFIGLLLFMTPVSYNNDLTIPIAVLAKGLQAALAEVLPLIVTVIVVLSALATILTKLMKPRLVMENAFLKNLLDISPVWFVVRLLGALFIVLTFSQTGPEMINSGGTGALVLNDLLPILFCVFLFAGLLLPLLLNFGLLELLGALLTKVMRPLFNLPGRSAIDCMTSWLGDGSVGILLTTKQYEEKFYTQREAAVIGTTFSAVSITFSLVVISQVQLEHMFIPFYMTVCMAGVLAAIIVPRLPPLSHKKDLFIDQTERKEDDEVIPAGYTAMSWGMDRALYRADNAGGVKHFLTDGTKNMVDMIFGVLPVVMGIGTLALIIAEYTPIFSWLGMPFIPLLELLQIPYAEEASKTIVVGFADMFIPSILAASIDSEMTRFVIATLSVTQLIYMSEVGALLLGSRIPVKVWELFAIFILRTLVTLPFIALMAHLFF
ncbi:YjiH family protein [Shewanella sp. GXUN23E]|uniref:YjiH family protein n=1 Tax=Shewanella sp. GXUN23E TaxID=3422498 RepID=UPI003D7EBCD7